MGDLVALGLWHRIGPFGALGRAERRDLAEALAAVGISGFERRGVGSLSGGQLQRALFARVLLQDAPLILLDEPFTAIDARTTADLIALVQRWHGKRAPSSRCCMTWRSPARTSHKPCCWPASPSPGGRRRRC